MKKKLKQIHQKLLNSFSLEKKTCDISLVMEVIKDLAEDKLFSSDEEAKKAGLNSGDIYRVKPNCEPYFLSEETLKRVL